jgi:hypothetical protein
MKLLKMCFIVVFTFVSYAAQAEPRTAEATIVWMRPYTTGDYFVNISSSRLTTGATCTTVYRVKADDPGAKGVIATLLTAYSLGAPLQLEVPTNTGCEGYGTPIQSVFLTSQ